MNNKFSFFSFLIFAYILGANGTTYAQTLGTITVKNSLTTNRNTGVVEIPFELISSKIKTTTDNVIIKDEKGTELPIQWIKNQAGETEALLILSSLEGNQEKSFGIFMGKPHTYKALTFGRFVPERFDDFAWENDKVAFRMYGPALSGRSDNAYGTDVWSKRTSELIIDKWYKKGKYHDDEGEGCDYYHVGFTLGGGSIEPYADSICFAKNYASYQVIENGPLRTTFILGYKPWKVGKNTVEATRKITLDAGTHMNKIEVFFTILEGNSDSLTVVSGLVKRNKPGTMLLDESKGILAYWEPTDASHGTTGTAVIFNNNKKMSVTNQHLLVFDTLKNKQKMTYYNGQAYDRQGDATNATEWIKYVVDFKASLETPLIINCK